MNLLFILCFILSTDCFAETSLSSNTISAIHKNSNIKLSNEIYSLPNLKKIQASFYPWSSNANGLHKKFNNDADKNRIRNNKSVWMHFSFENTLVVLIKISTFRSVTDATVGFADVKGYFPAFDCNEIFLNETIETKLISGSKILIAGTLAQFNFTQKNTACCITLYKNSDFITEDFKIVNKIIRILLKSIKNSY